MGPTLALLAERPARALVLVVEPARHEAAEALRTAVGARHPGVAVECVYLSDAETADLARLLARLGREVDVRAAAVPVAVSVGAGPVAARAAWMVTALSRPDVEVLDVVPRGHAGARGPAVVEWRAGRTVAPPLVREPVVAYRAEAGDASGRLTRGAAVAPDLERAIAQIGLVGDHPAFRRALETAASVAPVCMPVLVHGETGTGKGMLARLIHLLSGRPADRFVSLNCAALPENLVESMLFGHKRGAFTGAATDYVGKFAAADGGTLFLDEIGELPLALQPKLLKVLEDGVVEPLGASRGQAVDVRVVAATHRDLRAAVAQRTFREDLYYRIAFARVDLPALRERRSDIQHLALRVLQDLNATLYRPRSLSPAALKRLEQHDWPGNIRDLQNAIGRSVLLVTKTTLDADDLVLEPPASAADPLDALPEPHAGFSLEQFLHTARRRLILRALDQSGGNQSAAARLLGLTPQAVHRFLRETET